MAEWEYTDCNADDVWVDYESDVSDSASSISQYINCEYYDPQWNIEENTEKWVRKMRAIDKKHLKNRNRRITSKAYYCHLVKIV